MSEVAITAQAAFVDLIDRGIAPMTARAAIHAATPDSRFDGTPYFLLKTVEKIAKGARA